MIKNLCTDKIFRSTVVGEESLVKASLREFMTKYIQNQRKQTKIWLRVDPKLHIQKELKGFVEIVDGFKSNCTDQPTLMNQPLRRGLLKTTTKTTDPKFPADKVQIVKIYKT